MTPHLAALDPDWINVAITIAVIAGIFIVLPIGILWSRDRGHLKTFWGVVALLAALGILSALFHHFGPGRGYPWETSGTIGVVIALVLIWLGAIWIRDGGPGIEHVPPDFKCEELSASIGKAREAIPWFLEQVAKNIDGAFVKFPLRTPNGGTEHIWAYVHSFRDGLFNVSLANDPYDRSQSPDGRRDVALADVEDWQVMYPDGRIKGCYSVLAVLANYESRGKLSRRMRRQRAQFIDAAGRDGA
jgi:uncharacterized protein YegJ (DUF2314 family)